VPTPIKRYTSEDRWEGEAPLTNTTAYSTELFGERALSIVGRHAPATPLFVYLAWQAVHDPCVTAARAVQSHPHGGQFDFVWLSARTPHGAYVW